MSLNFIFDRTQADVDYAKTHKSELTDLKGSYNVSDMTRVNEAVSYLTDVLNENGYYVEEPSLINWTENVVPTNEQMSTYLMAVNNIKLAFNNYVNLGVPRPPDSLNLLTYTGANAIEEFLFNVYTNIVSTVNIFIRLGVGNVGVNRTLQSKFMEYAYYTIRRTYGALNNSGLTYGGMMDIPNKDFMK